MNGTWKTMTQHQRVLTERVFDALSTLDEIGAADRPESRVS